MLQQDERFDVIIVGAGLAGLVAANAAADRGLRVAVLDAHPAGGRARTTDRNGWRLNIGPHALYRRGALAAALAACDIELPGGDPNEFETFGYRDGELHPLPLKPGALARTGLLGFRSKARFARLFASLHRIDPRSLAGTSLREWLGAEPDDVVALVETLVRTTSYVNAPESIDAGAAIGQLQLGSAGVRYLDGGWGRIVSALMARLAPLDVVVEPHEVLAIESLGTDLIVRSDAGDRRAASVIVAAGGPELEQRLLGTPAPGVGPKVEATCLDLLLDRPAPRVGAFGVGAPLYLTPHSVAADLAPAGGGLMSGVHYLAVGSDPSSPADEQAAIHDLAAVIGVPRQTVVDERYLHRVTVAHSFPSASRGGLAGRPGAATEVDGVYRAGDWVGPFGFIGDAAAASGRAAATAAAARCARIVA